MAGIKQNFKRDKTRDADNLRRYRQSLIDQRRRESLAAQQERLRALNVEAEGQDAALNERFQTYTTDLQSRLAATSKAFEESKGLGEEITTGIRGGMTREQLSKSSTIAKLRQQLTATSTDDLPDPLETKILNLAGEEVSIEEFTASINPDVVAERTRERVTAQQQAAIAERAQLIQVQRDSGVPEPYTAGWTPEQVARWQLFGAHGSGQDLPLLIQEGFATHDDINIDEVAVETEVELQRSLAEQGQRILSRRQEIALLREDQRQRLEADLGQFREEAGVERGRIEEILRNFGGTAEDIQATPDLQAEGATSAVDIARQVGQQRLLRKSRGKGVTFQPRPA